MAKPQRILRLRSKREPHRLLALSIPAHMHEYFTLYVCAKSITKSRVIRPWLDDWYRRTRSVDTDDVLIQEIVARLNKNYRLEFKPTGYPFKQYKEDSRMELTAQRLRESYIEQIIQRLEP